MQALNSLSVTDHNVLLIGADDRNGSHLAERYLDDGARVTLVAATETEAQELVDYFAHSRPEGAVRGLADDFSDTEIQGPFERALDEADFLTIVLPALAVGAQRTGDWDAWRAAFDRRVIHLCDIASRALGAMAERGFGRVTFILPEKASDPGDLCEATREALIRLTEPLARTVTDMGPALQVITLEPGAADAQAGLIYRLATSANPDVNGAVWRLKSGGQEELREAA